jgi:hypothetical protein
MITKVPLEYAGDRRYREANKRALMWIEASARFDQARAGNLKQVLLIFTAMNEPARQRFSQPEMGSDHFIENLLSLNRTSGLGGEQKLVSAI